MDKEEAGLPSVSLREMLTYRKIAMATVGAYLGLDDEYLTAILSDAMDEYLTYQFNDREMLKREDYAAYTRLLARESVMRYAGTAAEGLAAPPDSALAQTRVMGDTGGLGMADDVNVIVRIQEVFPPLEMDGNYGDEPNQILTYIKRQMCNYYNACAYDLVRRRLLSVIVTAAEEYYRSGTGGASPTMSVDRIRTLLAGETEG